MPVDPPSMDGPPDDDLGGALDRASEPLSAGDVTAARATVSERGRRAVRRRRAVAGVAGAAAAVLVVVGIAVAAADHDTGSERLRTGDGSTTTVEPTVTTSTTPATTVTTAVPPATADTTTSTSPPTTTSTVAPPVAGCTEGSADPPAGAVIETVGDVDADGKADQAWLAWTAGQAGVDFGIRTAAGGGSVVPFPSASPITRAALVVDVDQRGPTEILFDDGRLVTLHAFVDCRTQPVLNPQGETYTFGLGGITGIGTGIGCIGTPAGRRLAGLNIDSQDGSRFEWSSTEVDLDGLTARNGEKRTGVYVQPGDDAKIHDLTQVTCGGANAETDGVILAPR